MDNWSFHNLVLLYFYRNFFIFRLPAQHLRSDIKLFMLDLILKLVYSTAELL